MSGRNTRTIQIILPGGKSTADSLAHILETILTKGLDQGERIEAIRGNLANMAETLTIEIMVSAPAEVAGQQMLERDAVDDRRR